MRLLKEFGLKVQEDNEKKIGKLPEKREKPCEIQSVIPFKVHWLAVPKKFREVVEIWTCCAEFFFFFCQIHLDLSLASIPNCRKCDEIEW